MLKQVIRDHRYYGYIKVLVFYFNFAQISTQLILILIKATGKNVQCVLSHIFISSFS